MSQAPPFVAAFKEASPPFGEAVEQLIGLTFAPGALEAKYKLLIALALDVEAGIVDGATVVAQLARDAGATDAEVREAIEMAAAVKLLQTLHIGVHALPAT